MVRWLSGNWIWLVFIGAMLWMHLGMHGRHGHGTKQGHGHGAGTPLDDRDPGTASGGHADHRPASTSAAGASHRHRGC